MARGVFRRISLSGFTDFLELRVCQICVSSDFGHEKLNILIRPLGSFLKFLKRSVAHVPESEISDIIILAQIDLKFSLTILERYLYYSLTYLSRFINLGSM